MNPSRESVSSIAEPPSVSDRASQSGSVPSVGTSTSSVSPLSIRVRSSKYQVPFAVA